VPFIPELPETNSFNDLMASRSLESRRRIRAEMPVFDLEHYFAKKIGGQAGLEPAFFPKRCDSDR